MPTVLRVAGFRFYFYSHENNEPAHVHIDRSGASAKVWLDHLSLARSAGYSAQELSTILGLVRVHRERLLEGWHEFFGTG